MARCNSDNEHTHNAFIGVVSRAVHALCTAFFSNASHWFRRGNEFTGGPVDAVRSCRESRADNNNPVSRRKSGLTRTTRNERSSHYETVCPDSACGSDRIHGFGRQYCPCRYEQHSDDVRHPAVGYCLGTVAVAVQQSGISHLLQPGISGPRYPWRTDRRTVSCRTLSGSGEPWRGQRANPQW